MGVGQDLGRGLDAATNRKRRSDSPKVISRADAKAQGLARFFTGRPCKNGHIAERMVSNHNCLDCQCDTNTRGRNGDPERFKRYNRETSSRFLERHPGYSKERYWLDPAKNIARSLEYQRRNPEGARIRRSAYKKRKPHVVAENTNRRRAAQLNATPVWLTRDDFDLMRAIYEDAATRPDGPWHVDHIVPMISTLVCGLHVPWNLRVVPALENYAKNNRLDPALAEAPVDWNYLASLIGKRAA